MKDIKAFNGAGRRWNHIRRDTFSGFNEVILKVLFLLVPFHEF